MTPLRLTWVQPEDLIAHELRQAKEDGRDARRTEARWATAGGTATPAPSGASPTPAPPLLRALAIRLLDELAEMPSPLADREPTDFEAIRSATPTWPDGLNPPPTPGHSTEKDAGDKAPDEVPEPNPEEAQGRNPAQGPEPEAPGHPPTPGHSTEKDAGDKAPDEVPEPNPEEAQGRSPAQGPEPEAPGHPPTPGHSAEKDARGKAPA
ncbi:ADP-ribosylglycohydrolase family protein, partial [Streptomyces sp. NPDC059994]